MISKQGVVHRIVISGYPVHILCSKLRFNFHLYNQRLFYSIEFKCS